MDWNEPGLPLSPKSNESRSVSASLPPDSHTLPAGLTCGSGRATGMNLLIHSFNHQAGGNKDFLGFQEDKINALHAHQTPAVLISCVADFPAKTSASPGGGPDSPANGQASSMKSSASPKRSSRHGASLKMSQGSLVLTEDGTWPRSLKDFGNAGLWSATECWTAVIGESHNGAVECSLSAVLLPKVSSKYSLTPRAAAGILRRATKRGRTLPPDLEAVLQSLASTQKAEAARTT